MAWWALAGVLGVIAGLVVTLVWHLFLSAEELLLESGLGVGQGSYLVFFAFLACLLLLIFARRLSLHLDSFTRFFFDVHYRQGNRRESHTFLNGLVSFAAPLSGGIVGLEGAVIEWSSMLASKLGEIFHIARKHHCGMIACALGAGLSAQLANPFLGIVFVLEVVFAWSFPASYFGPLAIAAFAATGVSQGLLSTGWFRGAIPGFDAGFSLFLADGNFFLSMSNLVFLVPLVTIAVAVIIIVLLWSVQESESLATRVAAVLPWPKEQGESAARLALWGSATAVILYSFPLVLGLGQNLLVPTFWQQAGIGTLGGIIAVRFLLVVLSFTAFRSLGAFIPIIFLGAYFGYFGNALLDFFGVALDSGHALALLMAGGFLSAAFGAPVTACVCVYFLADAIVPERGSFLLAAIIINFSAHYLVGLVCKERFPTLGLHRLGLRFRDGLCFNTLSPITVRDAMLSWIQPIAKDASLGMAYSMLLKSRFTSLPITDHDKSLVGMLSLSDFQDLEAWRSMEHDSQVAELIGIEDIMQPIRSKVESTMQLDRALSRMRDEDIVPVVEPDSGRFIGLLQRSDLENVYNKDVLRRLVSHEHLV